MSTGHVEAVGAGLSYLDQGRPVDAVADVDLSVVPGEFIGILGPSGSGKSSLLYLLSGLKTPSRGEVRYNGRSLSQMSEDERATLRMQKFGFVFQQPYLLGYLSALENILAIRGSSAERALSLLAELGLSDKAHRLPHELSGGERQRVCVARALVHAPDVIFADEPTAALDHRNGIQTVELLRRLRGAGSLVMVTHDPSMLEGADRVVRLADGQLVD